MTDQNEASQTKASVQIAGTPENTYYLYSFDGKLLAEYNTGGSCVKDYIYLGNKLLAEYQPPPIAKYYYYTSDQITSTRIVTDDVGTVVYSAAFDPYGGVQKLWQNTYDPKLKFSGKEREPSTDIDYFGARYYDYLKYRFLSVDPVINKKEAFANPQLWDLYSYCGNNPISNFDPDGMRINPITNTWGISGPISLISMNVGMVGLGTISRSVINSDRGRFGAPRQNASGRYGHSGLDITGTRGSSIRNAEFGKVVALRGTDTGTWGKYVQIISIFGSTMTYAHLDSVAKINIGSFINEGQIIGTVGISGNAQRNGQPLQDYPVHLHMEVTDISGNNADPEKWLNDPASNTSSNFRLEESKKKKEQ